MIISRIDLLKKIEKTFVLSPILATFWVIFNVADTKFIISRLLIAVSTYCFFRYKNVWIKELKKKLPIIAFGILFCGYFFVMQYTNEGNSDLPRSILYILIYFIFLPLGFLNSKNVFNISSFGAIFSGIVSLYELYNGETRVGWDTLNPIPFSYYAGLCLIVSIFFFYSLKRKYTTSLVSVILFFLSMIFGSISIVFSQTRATYLAITILFFIGTYPYIYNKRNFRSLIIVFLSYLIVGAGAWHIPQVKLRVMDAWSQVNNFSNESYNSSTGIRVKLWQSGIDISAKKYIFGNSKEEIRQLSEKYIDSGKIPYFLKPFLIHPNPNFHNQYIQNLTESGIVGLLLLFILLSFPFFYLRKSRYREVRYLGGAISIYTSVCFCFDSLFLYNHTVILYGVVMVLLFNGFEKGLIK